MSSSSSSSSSTSSTKSIDIQAVHITKEDGLELTTEGAWISTIVTHPLWLYLIENEHVPNLKIEIDGHTNLCSLKTSPLVTVSLIDLMDDLDISQEFKGSANLSSSPTDEQVSILVRVFFINTLRSVMGYMHFLQLELLTIFGVQIPPHTPQKTMDIAMFIQQGYRVELKEIIPKITLCSQDTHTLVDCVFRCIMLHNMSLFVLQQIPVMYRVPHLQRHEVETRFRFDCSDLLYLYTTNKTIIETTELNKWINMAFEAPPTSSKKQKISATKHFHPSHYEKLQQSESRASSSRLRRMRLRTQDETLHHIVETHITPDDFVDFKWSPTSGMLTSEVVDTLVISPQTTTSVSSSSNLLSEES
jgi:hypothetical protein